MDLIQATHLLIIFLYPYSIQGNGQSFFREWGFFSGLHRQEMLSG